MTQHKSFPICGLKVLDEEQGIVEAYVSVFGNVDHGGDRVLLGAFDGSLKRWDASEDVIPVIFTHKWDDIDAHVGEVLEAKEVPPGDPSLPEQIREFGGLYVKKQYDLTEEGGRKVFKRLRKRAIKEFSFAYDTIKEKRATDGANDLIELDLIEVGPTLKGMNPLTVLAGAKSASKAWPRLSGSFEELKDLLSANLYPSALEHLQNDDDVELSYIWGVYIEATFADRVVVSVDYVDTENDVEIIFLQFPYTIDADGNVELGEGIEVQFVATPKADPRSEILKRRKSVKKETVTEKPEETKSRTKPEEPATAKGEEFEVRSPLETILAIDEAAEVPA